RLFFLLAAFAPAIASAAAFKPDKLAEIDTAITEAIADKKLPGGVLWLEQNGVEHKKIYGNRSLVPAEERTTEDTIYDAASLTKVVATTTAIMQLVERGKLDLNAPVARYIPDFAANGKENVTVRQLITHFSGLRPDLDYKPAWSSIETAVKM